MMAAGAQGEHLFWAQERWRHLQRELLATHVRHSATSPLYRELKLSTDQPLEELPLTTKDQLATAGKQAWAVGPDQVREWVSTSGTTGRPLDVPLTSGDLQRLAENEATALSLAGLRAGDLCLLAVAMDRLFVAGLAYHLGAGRIGAACARIGPGVAAQPELLGQIIDRLAGRDQRVFLIAVPSFLQRVESSALAGVIAIGEPTRTVSGAANVLAAGLHQRLHCPIMSTYALTETCATFAESPLCAGGHLNPRLACLEILDAQTQQPVPDGHVGEVVITPLGVTGMPLLRFRTGDIAWKSAMPCPCGRTTPRLGPIVGRQQQLLKIRGTSLYPSAILEALRMLPFFTDACLIATAEHALSDRVTVHVHIAPDNAATRGQLASTLKTLLRVTPEIVYVDPAALTALQTSESRKPQRFIDRR